MLEKFLTGLFAALADAIARNLLGFASAEANAPTVVHDALPDPTTDDAVAGAIAGDVVAGRVDAD